MTKKLMKKMKINGVKIDVKLPEGIKKSDLPKSFKADPEIKVKPEIIKVLKEVISV